MATTGGAQDEWNQFQARNTQDRRTQHPSDSPRTQSDTDSRDSGEETHDSRTTQSDGRIPWTGPRDVIPNKNYGYSTGPKGIIQDARDQRSGRNASQSRHYSPRRHDDIQPYVENLHDGQPQRARRSSSEDEDDAIFRDLENDTANTHYDQSRRTELQRQLRLADVSGSTFETLIASAKSDVMVVGFIYDDHPEIWHRLEFCLQSVAKRHEGMRCVKVHYEEAKFERSSAPAILAYRDTDEVAHILNIYEELSIDKVDVDAVEHLFHRYHII